MIVYDWMRYMEGKKGHFGYYKIKRVFAPFGYEEDTEDWRRLMGWFALDQDRNPLPLDDVDILRNIVADKDRRVDLTYVNDAEISTVFLGLEHGFGQSIYPVLYETMVFEGNPEYEPCWRYTSEEEAKIGHLKAVALLENT